MRSKIGASVIGGLVAGIIMGMMMQMMSVPAPNGGRMSMMVMVAQVVRSDSIVVGWLYHLFNSAVFGATFGWLLGGRVANYRDASVWGTIYGVVVWVLGGQIAMPVLLGMPPFAALAMPPMRMVAMGSLVGHIVFGLVLAYIFVRLHSTGTERPLASGRPATT